MSKNTFYANSNNIIEEPIDGDCVETTANIDTFKSAVIDAIKIPNMFVNPNVHSSTHSHSEDMDDIVSDEHVKIKAIVEKYWPESTPQQKMEYYNALKNSVISSRLFLQHCRNNNMQIRVVQYESSQYLRPENGKLIIPQLGDFYDEAKDFYRQATNVMFIGSVINIKNRARRDGHYIDIRLARRTSTSVIGDANMFDVDGIVASISNRDTYTKFVAPTMFQFTTRSITEVISNFMTRDDWEKKKNIVFDSISRLLQFLILPEEIKNSGNKLRCIDMTGPLGYDEALPYKAFKDRCALFANYYVEQPGRYAVVHDTYISVTPVGGSIPYKLTAYGIFLLDGTVNKNMIINIDDRKRYRMLPFNTDDAYELIEDILNATTADDNATVARKINEMQIKINLSKYGAIVVKDGVFVRPYKEDEKLSEGEEKLVTAYTFFTRD